ncbi:LOW QUALITY PROTEIN: hypothetical protein ACHAXS_001227 [Conticribra weissflogii]
MLLSYSLSRLASNCRSLPLRKVVDHVVQNKASATRAWFASAPASSENWSPSDDDGSSMSKLFNKTDDHAALRQMIRSFTEREVEPQALEHNRNETLNIPLFRKLGSGNDGLGILGLTVPEEYGGTGLPCASAVAIVHEELSYSDPAFCLSYLAHSILLANNLAVNGSEKQSQVHSNSIIAYRFYHVQCSKIGGMCMSEPDAGTDVLGMKSSAVYDPIRDGYVLNGTKMWITNGTLTGKETGDLFLVYARTGTENRTQITQFVVEGGMEGFSLGQKINDKLGMRAEQMRQRADEETGNNLTIKLYSSDAASPTAELVFQNVFLPASSHVVGEVDGATLCMMRNLEIERVALAAMAVGIARRALDEMISYAANRPAFGKPDLFSFGQIQKHISESYAEYMAGKCYLYGFSNGLDLSTYGNGLDADGVKQ